MTRDAQRIRGALSLAAIALLLPARAEAYIDPGSGSFLIQMLLAGLLAAGMTIKLYWRKLKSFIGRTFNSKQGPSEPNDE